MMHNYNMKNYSNHIAIIGAGISGLSLGIVLKKNNIDCIIFEKSKNISEHGAGISISQNGIKILESLDVFQKINDISSQPEKAVFHSNNNKIIEMPINVVTTSRKNLYQVLLNKYISLGGEILFNHELSGLNIDNIEISFTNNLNLKVKHIAACDGIRSICYSKIFNEKNSVYSGYSVWRAIFPLKQSNINFYLGSNYHVVTYPIDNERISFVGAIKKEDKFEESWRENGSFEDLMMDIPEYILQNYPSIKITNEIYKWGVYSRSKPMNLYSKNITYLGDAAHPIVPFIGQGACLSLEDSYTFGELLSKYDKDINKAQIKYHKLRIGRIKLIRMKSLNQAKLNHLNNPILVFIRNLLMKYTNIISYRTRDIWSYDVKKIIKNN